MSSSQVLFLLLLLGGTLLFSCCKEKKTTSQTGTPESTEIEFGQKHFDVPLSNMTRNRLLPEKKEKLKSPLTLPGDTANNTKKSVYLQIFPKERQH